MNRRDLFRGFAIGAAGLMVPEPVRAYSFIWSSQLTAAQILKRLQRQKGGMYIYTMEDSADSVAREAFHLAASSPDWVVTAREPGCFNLIMKREWLKMSELERSRI